VTTWPITPQPRRDESLMSWFTRVGRQYAVTPCELLDAVEHTRAKCGERTIEATLRRLRYRPTTDRIAQLARLPVLARERLWRRPTLWELRKQPLRIVCPQCWLDDIDAQTEPYGRQCWQQAWCTICEVHSLPLVRSRLAQEALLRSTPSADRGLVELRVVMSRLRESACYFGQSARRIVDALLEIQCTARNASLGAAPEPAVWGTLQPDEFLRVLADVTTWALTHFEPVLAWSAAEDLTDIEHYAGNMLLGRFHRGLPGEYPAGRSTRAMNEVPDPSIRRSALWLAHALMANRHVDVVDRVGGDCPQVRQRLRLCSAAPAGLHWLAARSQGWPAVYRSATWINLEALADRRR